MAALGQGFAFWLDSRREECIKSYQRVVKLSMTEADRGRKISGTQMEPTTAGVDSIDNMDGQRRNSRTCGGRPPDSRRLGKQTPAQL